MDETTDCQAVSPLLAELATGAATGHDRADAVRHVAGCPACRQEVAELARVADDLLLLVPEREPPPDFETAVARRIANLTDKRPPRRRFRPRPGSPGGAMPSSAASRWLPARTLRLAAAAIVLAVAAGGGATAAYWQTASDRQLADRYRQTIATGSQLPRATPVTSTTGVVVGHLFLYEGNPSFAMVAITDAPQPGNYSMDVLTTTGNTYSVGVCAVTGHSGIAGYQLTVPVGQIAAVELSRPGIRLTAHPA